MKKNLIALKQSCQIFMLTLPLAKLDMISARLFLNFLGDIPVDFPLLNFLLLFNISELSVRAKTKIFDNQHRW